MTLKQLEAFYWACTLGSFEIAAQRLHVTQSSLSKRIAELESDLRKPLFDRSGKRAVMTAAGEMLLEHARGMLDLEETIRVEFASGQDELSGTTRFGISELSASTWFPKFVQRLYDQYPRLSLEPQVGVGRTLETRVTRGELDFAVIAGPATHDAVASQVIASVDYSWMASPTLFSRGTVLTTEQIASHVVIAGQIESGATHVFNDWIAMHNVKLRRVLACNSSTTITGLTVAAVGISYLPLHHVRPLVERNLLVPLTSEPPVPRQMQFSFIYRRDDRRPLIQILKRVVLEEVDFSIPNKLWTAHPDL
jgi:DNA-binding transcriptional LysR family regulator